MDTGFIEVETQGVPTMKKYFLKVAELKKNTKYPKMYETLEKIMLDRKNIHPNVDYPCGPTYHLMGIDTDFFTPVFVMARITGWSAHILNSMLLTNLLDPCRSTRVANIERFYP